jgi:hypothetical protein
MEAAVSSEMFVTIFQIIEHHITVDHSLNIHCRENLRFYNVGCTLFGIYVCLTGAQVMEFCPHGTKVECTKVNSAEPCKKLHFKKIIQKHTDESLGDCSFLNTCFHMDTCKYVFVLLTQNGLTDCYSEDTFTSNRN